VDSHRPGSFAVHAFSSEHAVAGLCIERPVVALRKFRPALETKVEFREKPHSVMLGKRSLAVLAASGPWSTSGHWWNHSAAWAHEEWDVALKTSDGPGLYRIYFDRMRTQWFIAGMFD